MHIVHSDPNREGQLFVIGIFFDLEKGGKVESLFLRSLGIDKLDLDSTKVDVSLLNMEEDLFLNFDSDTEIYNYKGSLTTPPCSETVNWVVIDKAQTISKEQLA